MDAFPDSAFRAEITELGTIADPVTGTYEAELLIRQAHPQFRTGFISRVEIWPTHHTRSMVVPVESIQDATDYRAHVFVYEEGKARKRSIRTGRILGDEVVVMEGLEEGEQVITEGAMYLKPDSEVYLIGQSESP
jgi:multidrug efflux pump subunit AcrA (membrane-fusion protein)